MKTIVLLVALVGSTTASAMCYQIFAPGNELVWQNTTAPVAMDSPSIADEIRKIVPGGHLVIVDDRSAPCPAFDAVKRKSMRERAQEINDIHYR